MRDIASSSTTKNRITGMHELVLEFHSGERMTIMDTDSVATDPLVVCPPGTTEFLKCDWTLKEDKGGDTSTTHKDEWKLTHEHLALMDKGPFEELDSDDPDMWSYSLFGGDKVGL